MVTLGVYGLTGAVFNSALGNMIKSVNESGRFTGNYATSSQPANLNFGGGVMARHFFSYLGGALARLGFQASADFYFFENGRAGMALNGDPKEEQSYEYGSHSALTFSGAAVYNVYRHSHFAVHLGAGALLSTERFTLSQVIPTGGSGSFELEGTGLGIDTFATFEVKAFKHMNLFIEAHLRYLPVTEFKSSDGFLQSVTPTGVATNEDNPSVLEVRNVENPESISWDQTGAQLRIGVNFFYF